MNLLKHLFGKALRANGAVYICAVLIALLMTMVACGRSREPQVLQIGVLPTRGALPLYVAQEKGYFADEGLDVKLIDFQSPAEKDAAFQAQEIDAMFSDLVAAALLRGRGEGIKVVALISGGEADEGRVAIVAAPQSGVQELAQLSGKTVALSPNTIMDFVTDELLARHGIAPEEIERVPVGKIHLRLAVLLEGKVAAATLPEPQITYAERAGGKVLVDDTDESRTFLVLAARQEICQANPESVHKMVKAYNRAVEEINRDPTAFRETLIRVGKFPKEAESTAKVTRYAHRRVPDEKQVARVIAWLQKKGTLADAFSYDALVEKSISQPRGELNG